MIEAIEIGGLNCRALLNESSAITLAYGFQKLKEFDEEKEYTTEQRHSGWKFEERKLERKTYLKRTYIF